MFLCRYRRLLTHSAAILAFLALMMFSSDVRAQRQPIQIGGPNGITIGGGMGFKVGGRNGIHFGGGQGAKFGAPEFGMHFGNGQGARFGGENLGMQFGGGEGAKFSTPITGMQFGGGQGAVIGPIQIGGRGGNGGVRLRDRIANRNAGAMNGNAGLAQSGRMALRLADDAGEPFQYALNGTVFQIQPGRDVFLQAGQNWTVTFSPGPGLEEKSYPISKPGRYIFDKSDAGWDLTLESEQQPTIETATEKGPIESQPILNEPKSAVNELSPPAQINDSMPASKLVPKNTPVPQPATVLPPPKDKVKSVLEKVPPKSTDGSGK